MLISIAKETISKMLPNLKILEKELKKKSKKYRNIIKILIAFTIPKFKSVLKGESG